MNIEISKAEFDALPREQQVIWLAADGKTDKNISQILGISTDTVSTYWKRIMVKFNSSSRTEVVATFLRQRFEQQMDRFDLEKRQLRSELRARGNTEQQQVIASVHLTALMNALDLGIMFTTPNLKVSFVNEQLCNLAGSMLLPKEVIGTDLEYFLAITQFRPVGSAESTFVRVKALLATDLDKLTDQVEMSDGKTIERTICRLTMQGTLAGIMILYRDLSTAGSPASGTRNAVRDILVERAMAHLACKPSKQRTEAVLTLKQLCGALKANRALIGEVDLSNGTYNICCAWNASGEDTFTDNYQPVPASFFPWLKSQIKDKSSWVLNSLNDIPKSASMEKAVYEEAGVRSTIGISFQGNDPSRAYFVDFSSNEEHAFDPSIVDVLRPIQTILRTVIADEKALTEKAEF